MGAQRHGRRLVCTFPRGNMTMVLRSTEPEALMAEVKMQVASWCQHLPPAVMAEATWSMLEATPA